MSPIRTLSLREFERFSKKKSKKRSRGNSHHQIQPDDLQAPKLKKKKCEFVFFARRKITDVAGYCFCFFLLLLLLLKAHRSTKPIDVNTATLVPPPSQSIQSLPLYTFSGSSYFL